MANPKSGKRHLAHQRRCKRLARHLVWHGKRLVGDDDDFVGGIHYPKHLLTRHDAETSSKWAIKTPNRWAVRATAYCQTEDGQEYREVIETETSQVALVNELSEQRIEAMREVQAKVNRRHLVAEGYEIWLLG